MDDVIGVLPYMVTVTTTKPIAPLFLPDLVVLSTIRAGFPKQFLETLSLLRHPGPWQVRSKKFRELLFESPHPHGPAWEASYTRDPPPLISNQHAILQLSCPASNEKSATLSIYGICLTLIAMGASVSGREPNTCPYREQTRRSQRSDWLEAEDLVLSHFMSQHLSRLRSARHVHFQYTPPSRPHPSSTILFSATAGKHGVHLLVGVADVWKGRDGKKAEASVAFSMGLDAWNSHIITPSRRGYVVAALIQSLLQLLPDA